MTTQTVERFSSDVVALMRGRVEELAKQPEHRVRLLLRLTSGLDRVIQQARVAMGVNSNEMSALLALWDGGRCSMSVLGERIGLSRAAVTAVVDRLEKKRYIMREPHPEDRRQIMLFVLPRFEEELWRQLRVFDRRITDNAHPTHEWFGFAAISAFVRDEATVEAEDMRMRRRRNPDGGDETEVVVPEPRQFW